ncbi:MAG: GrpB family protein [bacterium]
MIGLKTGTVKLSHYTTLWRNRYRAEERRLRLYTEGSVYLLEHIGSTAIQGLDAKPIIDIAMMIPTLRRQALWIKRLEAAGYTYKGEYGLPGRHFFTRGNPVTHHLHLVAKGCDHWTRWLLFRDYLRAHPEEAQNYNKAKKNLARKYSQNRVAYTQAKTPIINAILEKAKKDKKTIKFVDGIVSSD